MEGLGCVLGSIWGSGTALTSYSSNIAAISITKVASRRVVQSAALLMMVLSFFVKLTAIFVLIPVPVLGGVFVILAGVISAVGISSLKSVDLNSPRNLFVLGVSLFMGLCLPQWLHQNKDSIQLGSTFMNEICYLILSNSMLISGGLGFFLDNTIPGSDEERGLIYWREQQLDPKDTDHTDANLYKLPFNLDNHLSKFSCIFPICLSRKDV